ncbi:MAG: metallophosphoesterase [Clostridia bacterium]|nr:metallophosphoesterase [Clostridia bacterium]
MKKILIFSDSHGDINRCLDIINSCDNLHAVIHAGDYAGDAEDLQSIYPNLPVHYVKGNNDFFSRAPSYITVIIDGVRIYVTHGHEQRVKYEYDYRTLRNVALKENASLAVFGHTHIPFTSYDGGCILLNPGSIRFSATYAIAEIENGTVTTNIMEI